MKNVLISLVLLSAAALAQTKEIAGRSENGKALFLRNGCYQCHGQSGQGGLAGPRLAQTKLTQVAFMAYVREPAPGSMPAYRAKVMSDQELADVWAYIKTFPEPPPLKSIPILNP
jgi:mono/diheme cytochrome c family protein